MKDELAFGVLSEYLIMDAIQTFEKKSTLDVGGSQESGSTIVGPELRFGIQPSTVMSILKNILNSWQ